MLLTKKTQRKVEHDVSRKIRDLILHMQWKVRYDEREEMRTGCGFVKRRKIQTVWTISVEQYLDKK